MIMVFAVMVTLVSVVGGFLYAVSVFITNSGWEETDAQALWLADAGLQRAIWNLKTPSGAAGGQGENWTTAGTTEALGAGTYTMVVARWDFALNSATGATASAFSTNGGNVAGNAIDGNLPVVDGNTATSWESGAPPTVLVAQYITIAFPYTLRLNKVRFIAFSAAARPRDYTWQVSTDNVTYTPVVTVAGNPATDVTNTFSIVAFPAAATVNYLRLRVTAPGTAGTRVRVATLEAIGSQITSTGTVTTGGSTITRTVVQSVVADDAAPQNQVAYYEPDWHET